jgi:hypothetical protein
LAGVISVFLGIVVFVCIRGFQLIPIVDFQREGEILAAKSLFLNEHPVGADGEIFRDGISSIGYLSERDMSAQAVSLKMRFFSIDSKNKNN